MRSLYGMKLERLAMALALLLALAALPASAFAEKAETSSNAPAAASTSSDASSGEDVEVIKTTSLEDRIPPVSGRLFYKKHRFELTPGIDVSFGDAFFQKIGIGLKADYHLFDTFSVTAHVLYHFNMTSRAVSVCDVDGNCERPETDALTNVPGKLGLIAGAGISWTPLYGKLSLMAEHVLHFDFGITGGVDGIQYKAPENSEFTGSNKFAFGGHVGLLFRLAFTNKIALRFELRDYIYSGATVTLGDSTSKVENQIMFDIGLSFMLGEGSED